MSSLIPQNDGYLSYFLLYASLSAVIHTIFCYLSPPATALKAFSGPRRPEPNPLLAHVYGVKNVYTALIRCYAAYHLDNPQLYDLCMWTFVGVLGLYVTELMIWKTVRIREALFPFVTAGGGLVWMVLQRDAYLKH